MRFELSAMALSSTTFSSLSCFRYFPKIEVKAENKWRCSCAMRSQNGSDSPNSRRSYRKVWRRRKLSKKDETLDYRAARPPFLEERVRKIKQSGSFLSLDIERLLLSEENRFEFVNKVAAEARQYVEKNPDEYGGTKKAILHVLSDRMNDAGFDRPEAYWVDDPYELGPGSWRIQKQTEFDL